MTDDVTESPSVITTMVARAPQSVADRCRRSLGPGRCRPERTAESLHPVSQAGDTGGSGVRAAGVGMDTSVGMTERRPGARSGCPGPGQDGGVYPVGAGPPQRNPCLAVGSEGPQGRRASMVTASNTVFRVCAAGNEHRNTAQLGPGVQPVQAIDRDRRPSSVRCLLTDLGPLPLHLTQPYVRQYRSQFLPMTLLIPEVWIPKRFFPV